VSQPYESVSRVEVHFSDGSCAIVKNLGMDANAAILQLRHEVAELDDENKRLRKELSYVLDEWGSFKAGHSGGHGIDSVFNEWLAAKGGQS
jgi:hypothetical protein